MLGDGYTARRKREAAGIITVYGTPRVPENHARYVRHRVDACPH